MSTLKVLGRGGSINMRKVLWERSTICRYLVGCEGRVGLLPARPGFTAHGPGAGP